jgi:hypothetical protein
MGYLLTFRINTNDLLFSGSLHPTRPRFDYDHNTIDLSKLEKIIVQLDPENGPSLDTLLEKHQQELIKRAKDEDVPNYTVIPGQGYKCSDCRQSEAVMSKEMLQWHSLSRWVFWFLSDRLFVCVGISLTISSDSFCTGQTFEALRNPEQLGPGRHILLAASGICVCCEQSLKVVKPAEDSKLDEPPGE